MHILIAYASAHGSTAEIARFMAEELAKRGVQVTVSNVESVDALEGYDAVLLGSAIHNGMLLPEMSRFIRGRRSDLESLPIYLWVACIRILEPHGAAHVLQYYIPGDIIDQLPVRGVRVFAGKLHLDDLAWMEQMSLKMRYDGPHSADELQGDYRDWEQIREWSHQVADELAHELGPAARR